MHRSSVPRADGGRLRRYINIDINLRFDNNININIDNNIHITIPVSDLKW
jgi:hypothetical protein